MNSLSDSKVSNAGEWGIGHILHVHPQPFARKNIPNPISQHTQMCVTLLRFSNKLILHFTNSCFQKYSGNHLKQLSVNIGLTVLWHVGSPW